MSQALGVKKLAMARWRYRPNCGSAPPAAPSGAAPQ